MALRMERWKFYAKYLHGRLLIVDGFDVRGQERDYEEIVGSQIIVIF